MARPAGCGSAPSGTGRLLRLIASPRGNDEFLYKSIPPSRAEFFADDEPLGWEAEGWDEATVEGLSPREALASLPQAGLKSRAD
jgi:hypothetical protein